MPVGSDHHALLKAHRVEDRLVLGEQFFDETA